jgi:dTDP-4-dehydrorhamnose reductase
MYLLVGGDSEIGAVTAARLRGSGIPTLTTTRRTGDTAEGASLQLDLNRVDRFDAPPAVQAACIFVAVARLAACASDPEGSRQINVVRTLALVEKLVSRGVYTLFLSTNQVFDGSVAHVQADAPHSPVSAYGRQKAETETALLAMMAAGAHVGILRLAKVVSPGMKLLADWDRDLRAGRPVKAFADMTMAPAPTGQVAQAIAIMLEQRAPMIAQLTGPRDISYADVARHIAARAEAAPELVLEGSALDAGLPEGATPANTTLDSSYFRDRHGLVVPDALAVVDAALVPGQKITAIFDIK